MVRTANFAYRVLLARGKMGECHLASPARVGHWAVLACTGRVARGGFRDAVDLDQVTCTRCRKAVEAGRIVVDENVNAGLDV